MRLLVISRYFWPDTAPFAVMLPVLLKQWVDDGHDVTIFTAQPSQSLIKARSKQPWKEQRDGYQVVRFPLFHESRGNILLRLLNMLLFMTGVLGYVLSNKRYDIFSPPLTHPSYLPESLNGAPD